MKTVKLHEKYDSFTIENDICLLELASAVSFNQHVATIGLPADHEEYPGGTVCTVTGWGTTTEGGSLAKVLQKVSETVPLNFPLPDKEKVVTIFDCKSDITSFVDFLNI